MVLTTKNSYPTIKECQTQSKDSNYVKNNIIVSIIVPVYNVSSYIRKCVLSIINQTYKEIQVIFVDDASPDGSVQTITETLTRIAPSEFNYKILHHKNNRGLAAARNTGVKEATGKYIMHVDADDWIEPEMVRRLVEKAENENSDINIGGYYLVKTAEKTEILPHIYESKAKLIKNILCKNVPGSMWGKLIVKRLYDEHPDVWSIEGINHGEDYATMPRLLYYARSIAYVNEPLYNYNLTNTSSYTNNFTQKSMENMLKADGVLENFFSGKLDNDTIARMKLRTKLGMIKRGNHLLYKEISNLYNDIPISIIKQLSLSDQVLLKVIGRVLDKYIARLINYRLRGK